MNENELILYAYNASGFVSDSFQVDLTESVSLPITKTIIDIREPEKRQSDYSKTITLPGTSNNNKIFNHIFKLDRATINETTINYQPDFNPNLKVDAILYRSGIPQITGYLQLNNIKRTDGDIEYEVIIIGKFANMFQDLGEKNLNELDLSAYDHEWNRDNIVNSWDTSIIKNGTTYVNFNVSGVPSGEGYVYPLIDRGNSVGFGEITYPLNTMYPSVYVKQVVDSIFSQAGYRYESAFFNSERFKRLVVPFSGGEFRMSAAEVQDRTFDVSIATAYNFSQAGGITGVIDLVTWDTLNKDTTPSGFNLSTDKFVMPSVVAGEVTYRAELNLNLLNVTAGTYSSGSRTFVTLNIIKNTPLGLRSVIGSNTLEISTASLPSNSSVSGILSCQSNPTLVNTGDEVYCEFNYVPIGYLRADILISSQAGGYFFNSPSSLYQEDSSVNISSVLPEKVKQSEFLTWLIRAFNLYYQVDQIDSKKFIIEPRDDFYLNDFEDITNYLDISKEIDIAPMGLLDFRNFQMQYKEDDDEFNKKYQEVYREPYATKKFNVNNDFIKGDKTVELGFSASPLSDSKLHTRIMTKIRPEDFTTGKKDMPTYNIRLLYYGGIINDVRGFTMTYGASGSSTYSFPYAGMVDNVYAPTFDLGCGLSRAINYGSFVRDSVELTDANLFNLYWKRTIEEITDKDSKVVTAYFKFSPLQLNSLSFRKFYKIDKQFYRLHSVEYDLSSKDTTKVQFLKLKTSPVFTPSTTRGNGGIGSVSGGDITPMFAKQTNTTYFSDYSNTATKIQPNSDTIVLIDYSQKIWFIDSATTVYLPDANSIPPINGAPIIVIRNIGVSGADVYSINSSQDVDGGTHVHLRADETIWVAANNNKWEVLFKYKQP
jgi:hypothetical protein